VRNIDGRPATGGHFYLAILFENRGKPRNFLDAPQDHPCWMTPV
jgi:hypothetical protein